jgi:hypothetical protein
MADGSGSLVVTDSTDAAVGYVPVPGTGVCDCGITDSFDGRALVSGWGVSDSGLDWGVDGGSLDSGHAVVAGGRAYMRSWSPAEDTPPHGFGTQKSLTPSTGGVSLEAYFEFEIQDASFYPYVVDPTQNQDATRRLIVQCGLLAHEANETYVSLDINSSSLPYYLTVPNSRNLISIDRYNFDALGVDYTFDDDRIFPSPRLWSAGTIYKVRFKADYTDTWFRLWTGDVEPTDWLMRANTGFYDPPVDDLTSPTGDGDNGGAYFQLAWGSWYDSGSDFNLLQPDGVFIDNLSLWVDGVLIDRCTEYRFDDFKRTVDDGWGLATSGYGWVADYANPSLTFADVDGDRGRIVLEPGITGFTGANMTTGGSGTDPWNAATWTMTASAYLGWGDLSGSLALVLEVRRFDNSASVFVNIFGDGTAQGTDTVPVSMPFTLTGSDYVKVKWEVVSGVSDRFKVWLDGAPEPSAWLYESAPPTILTSDLLQLLVGYHAFTPTDSGVYLTRFDDMDFDYAGKPCYAVGGVPVFPPAAPPPDLFGNLLTGYGR